MNFIVYLISYPILWCLSMLPLRVLYVFSDFLFYVLYYLIGYRKTVVKDNLRKAFPEKSNEEIDRLCKKFFSHFLDIMMESVKSLTISKKEIAKRYRFKNPELVNNLAAEGRSIALVGAHQANWEWFFSIPLALDPPVYASYTKLANPYFDKVVKNMRSRFGVITVKSEDTVKTMFKNYKANKTGLYLLLSDQSPMLLRATYWTEFFGIKVPVHTGAATLSKKFNFAVVNYSVEKVKRGYYEAELTLITDEPKSYQNFDVIDEYLRLTEMAIRKQPGYYLWSHKRFKHEHSYDEWLAHQKKS